MSKVQGVASNRILFYKDIGFNDKFEGPMSLRRVPIRGMKPMVTVTTQPNKKTLF
jgi:hypothetical protein